MLSTEKCILHMQSSCLSVLEFVLFAVMCVNSVMINLKTSLLHLFLTEGDKEIVEDFTGQETKENQQNAETSK